MYGNYISSCRLVAAKRFGVFKVNEAPGTVFLRDSRERRCFQSRSSLNSVSDPRAFPLVSRRFYDTLGPVSAGLLQLPSGLARMTS